MSAVEIAVPEHKLAARLVAIETWLYKKKCKPVRFETTPEQSGVVLIRVEFDADRMVEAFRRAFDPLGAGLNTVEEKQIRITRTRV
jgi:hypothetical protein